MASRRVVAEGLTVLAGAAIAAWALLADDRWFEIHWVRQYCFLEESTRTSAHVARGVAAALALVVVFVVRPHAPRVTLRATIPIALSVVAALAVTEVVLRRREAAKPVPPPPIGAIDHGRRQSVDIWFGGRMVNYALDEHGFRTRSQSASIDPAAPSVVLSGESVAFGFGLEYEETIGARLAPRLGLQDVNAAVSGFSNAQILEDLRHRLPIVERPVAVVVFVVYTWIERNLYADRPRLGFDRDGQLITIAGEPESSSPLLRLGKTLVRYHDDHGIELTRAILAETAKVIRSRGAHPLFVLTQCGARCIDPSRIVRPLTAGLDAQTLVVDFDPTLTIPNDIHPNAEAASRYALAIEGALREAKVTK